ncbi:MAG: TadE/TadG family type IV pilus assembly protein [Hyphomonadaceae bacterium]
MKISLFPSSLIRRAYRHGLKRAGTNEDGVSSIEFAIIAPFLLLLYFGGIELSLLMLADRQVTTTSSTMGDLASRLLTATDQDINNIFAASTQLLGNINSNQARLRISSLQNIGGTVTVVWSDATANFSALAPGQSVPNLPPDVVPLNGTAIMTETEFDYTSELGFFLKGQRNLDDRFFLRPRRTVSISRAP